MFLGRAAGVVVLPYHVYFVLFTNHAAAVAGCCVCLSVRAFSSSAIFLKFLIKFFFFQILFRFGYNICIRKVC